jgi:Effector Associated Constant Component 1
MTNASLTISLTGLPDTRLAQLTRDLARDLSRASIWARPIEAPSAPGEKGEAVTLGLLALAAVNHGAITAVIECFKAYFSRERTLVIKLTRPDGASVEITGHNVDTTAVRGAVKALAVAQSG